MRPVLGFYLILTFALIEFSHLTSALGQDKLPTGAELFAKAIKATGSEEAIKNLKSIRCEGKTKISEDVDATTVFLKLRNGKGLQELELEGNKSSVRVNGSTAWMVNANLNHKIPDESSVLYQILVEPLLPLEYQKYFDQVKTTGPAKFEGVKCYEVECLRKGKASVTYYFDRETGLEAGFTIEFPLDITIVYQDYREVDGLKLPYKILIQSPAQDQTCTIEKIIVNSDVDEKLFEIPMDLK